MTTGEGVSGGTGTGGWEGLDPWDKAAQWRAVDPKIADELVRLAKSKAVQDRREQRDRAKGEAEQAHHEREMEKQNANLIREREQSQREHEARTRELEYEREAHRQSLERERLNLERERLAIQKSLQTRAWWLQVISLAGGLCAIGVLAVVGLKLAESNTVSTTGVAFFGVVASLTATLLGANVSVGRKIQGLLASGNDSVDSVADGAHRRGGQHRQSSQNNL